MVYTVVGFVEFEGMACDPARAMFSTNRMPDAAFADLPDSVAVGEEVLFDASGSKDADGEIVEYRWDFGDGGKAEGATASHGWMQLGEFVVRLSVVDNEGGAGTVTRVVVVGEYGGCQNAAPTKACCLRLYQGHSRHALSGWL